MSNEIDTSDPFIFTRELQQMNKSIGPDRQSFALASCNSNTLMNMRDILKNELLFSTVNAAHVSSINGLDHQHGIIQVEQPYSLRRSSQFKIHYTYNTPTVVMNALDEKLEKQKEKDEKKKKKNFMSSCISCRTM